MFVCTVMVGLPALGKSTFIKNLKTDDIWIYSTDMYIDAVAKENGITYSEAFPVSINDAVSFNEHKLKTMTKLGRDILWDQTNLTVSKRRKIINRMRAAKYKVNCVCLLPPKDDHLNDQNIWKNRLDNRDGKIIPYHVLTNMIEIFVIPTINEGFDHIEYFDMYGHPCS